MRCLDCLDQNHPDAAFKSHQKRHSNQFHPTPKSLGDKVSQVWNQHCESFWYNEKGGASSVYGSWTIENPFSFHGTDLRQGYGPVTAKASMFQLLPAIEMCSGRGVSDGWWSASEVRQNGAATLVLCMIRGCGAKNGILLVCKNVQVTVRDGRRIASSGRRGRA